MQTSCLDQLRPPTAPVVDVAFPIMQTRRDFIAVTTTAVCAVVVSGGEPFLPVPRDYVRDNLPAPHLDLIGDPYLATVDHPGLVGRSFDDALQHALRFRSTAEDRDRYVLGLEF